MPQDQRLAAALALGDNFDLRRAANRWALLIMLAVSLVLHVAAVAMVSLKATAGGTDDLAAQEDTYFQKVAQKERGRQVAREMSGKITMPPPPPDPESVVQRAMTDSVTSDVEKITTGLLDVKLQGELSNYIKSNLKDELEAASKNIAQGKLSEGEIQQLHRKFQDKAQEMTIAWRQDYLQEHQVERAAVSTTEWYESDVSKTLFRNISFELWTPPGYRDHPPSPEMWHHAFNGGYSWDRYGQWFGMNSYGMFRGKVDGLSDLISGKWSNAGGKGVDQHPAWPGPNKDQAKVIAERLKDIRDGRKTVTYPAPSWKDVVYGSKPEPPCMTNGLLKEFFPHRQDEMAAHAKQFDELWDKLTPAAQDYLDKAEQGASDADLKGCLAAVIEPLKEIVQVSQNLSVKDANGCHAINRALRQEICSGPYSDEMYTAWVDEMVAGLEPLVKDFAKGQFKKGIIAHTGGVDEAMKEFPTKIVPLLRRDIERMLPAKKFHYYAFYPYAYSSSVVAGLGREPTDEEVKAEMAAAQKVVADWPAAEKPYLEKRRALLKEGLRGAVDNVKEAVLERVLTGNLLMRQMDVFVEGVDYTDKVQEKLNARAMALKGRGQDMAKLTTDGVPDTSAPLVALILGASKGHGANLEPVPTSGVPAMMAEQLPPDRVLIYGAPKLPRPPAKVGLEEQANVKPTFSDSPRFEAIPFMPRFPRLDGDLSDWGKIRPLILRGPAGQAILVYAAWNYQGFFFGYTVQQEAERFYWPSLWQMGFNHNTGGVEYRKDTGVNWAFRGDYFRLMFDTLDARNDNRGETHMQEYVVFPQGTESDPTVPGIEREIKSQRDAERKEYRGVKATCKTYPPQPTGEAGPDGSGPYRVTRARQDGYTMEVFMPRSLLKVPVFAPGWYIGFDCAVATGVQSGQQQFHGQVWSGGDADRPDRWGDLLMLGSDPTITVQEAAPGYPAVSTMIPGHSYLLTVIDPDRNVHPAGIDTVIVSAEVNDGAGDVEVLVLRETKENTGVFRGFINTQPGAGRQVQGVLEIMPMQEVRLGYVDFANSKGLRNVINEMRLPVVAPMLQVAAQK